MPKTDIIVTGAVLVFAAAALPATELLAVVVLGFFVASIICKPGVQDIGFQMLGLLNRGVFKALSGRQGDSIRAQVVAMCAAIDQYPSWTKSVLNRKKHLFFMLNYDQQKQALKAYENLKEIEVHLNDNVDTMKQIKDFGMEEYGITQRELWGQKSNPYTVSEIIEHIVRDWSDSGLNGFAREELFRPFWPHLANKQRVLVPGSGLGRFAVEIAKRLGTQGIVDAVELSVPMYMSSLFISTRSSETSLELYPYLLEFSHWRVRKDQHESAFAKLPAAQQFPHNVKFHWADFLGFAQGYKYDAIATLFFIDTAQNVFNYIDRIAEMLKPGGIWINYGPLKWGTAAFVEFSVDELMSYLESSNWVIEKTWTGSNRYNGSERSMLNTRYELVGWAARRT